MNKKDLRIVFMGTPDFAVESLKALVENNYNIVGVITAPDKPSGRGYKMQYSAVKTYAVKQNLPLLQPQNLKDDLFLTALRAWQADLQIIVAFRMLPVVVWSMPPLGTFNLHGSLLPQYRGAAPINWPIINGEKETGVTTFFLVHEIDMGKIIIQDKIAISNKDNAGSVHDKLMIMGAKLVLQTVDLILDDKVDAVAQEKFISDETLLKQAPKIFKDTCKIYWNQSAEKVHNHIRGLSPYPAACTELTNNNVTIHPVKILESEFVYSEHRNAAGSADTDNQSYLHIACTDGYINVMKMQLPGKRAMEIGEILRGYKFEKTASFK